MKKRLIITVLFSFYFIVPMTGQKKMDSVIVTVSALGKPINSAFADYGPVISEDGLRMIFTSRKPVTEKEIKKNKAGRENIYQSEYDSKTGNWSEPQIMKEPINQPNRFSSAIALSGDGQTMLLYQDDVNGNGDIYQSQLKEGNWTELVKLPKPINSDYIESSASVSKDGRTIYFCSNRKGCSGNSDIWFSTMDQNGNWSKAENIGSAINTKENEEGVFIHPDGKTLYFSSKGHNSMGGYDIFKSTFENGKWLSPVNVGMPINTINDDVYFVITVDGKTGYYTSAKAGGIGEKDIYKIEFTVYTPPQLTLLKGNIMDQNNHGVGSEIYFVNTKTQEIVSTQESNSTTGEFSVLLLPGENYKMQVITDDYEVYTREFAFSEEEDFKKIDLDIKLKRKDFILLESEVLDEDGNPVMATIEVINNATGEVVIKTKTDKSGKFSSKLKPGKNYGLVMSAEGYLFQSINLDVTSEKNPLVLTRNVLKRMEKGKNVVLNNIFFDFANGSLRDDSKPELLRLIEMLKEYPSLKIELSGHTDNKGSVAYNLKLSKDRAKSVMDYLVTNGIESSRVTFTGYWFSKPLASNDTEEGRTLNRRTELLVVEINNMK
ncbi:MAG: OmpA family protein [Bacteroidota bacterium]